MLKHWTDAQINDWLGRVYPQFLYVLLAEGLTIAAVWWVMRLRGLKLADIGWKRFRPIMLLYALCGFAVYFVAYLVLLAISSALAPSINLNQQQDIGFQQVSGPVQLLVTFISLAVLPPLAEEFLFRGFLFSNFRKYMKLPAAIILTSLLFAAPHLLESAQPGSLLWVAGIDTFTLSVVLCYLREKTGNLWPGILLHALKNSIAFVSIFIFHLS
jgi:membrane protease YdiL (CAAX protease family)